MESVANVSGWRRAEKVAFACRG